MLKPATKQARQLLIEGQIAFNRIERAGVRIDVPYLDKSIEDVRKKIEESKEELRTSKEYKLWCRVFGDKMKFNSHPQLGTLVFNHLGFERNSHAKKKHKRPEEGDDNWSNDEKAFEHIDHPFVKKYFYTQKLEKALGTYLLGIRREVVDGFVHPFQHLFRTSSYRPSCSDPNFANIPVRNKLISKIIRTSIIPRPGNVLLEPDYGAQEVRVSCCYHKDPTLIKDVIGGGDMHSDLAAKLFMLPHGDPEDPNWSRLRYVAKNAWVFPGFYGSGYQNCAPNIWQAVNLLQLKTPAGMPIFEHLASKGIKKLGRCNYEDEPRPGTFEAHCKEIYRWEWEEKFPVYDQWKKDWWESYQRQGGVSFLTGFVMEGIFRRNQVLCNVIQGAAFHCLLWSIIKTQKELLRYKMKAKIVNQIYDSALLDLPRSEVPNVTEIFNRIAMIEVRKHFKWICVPLLVDWKICEPNWGEKKHLEAAK